MDTLPPEAPCHHQVRALSAILLGVGTAAAFVMLANGRHREVYPLAGAVALVSAVFGAAQLLGAEH